MHKEINNANIFQEIITQEEFQKKFITCILSESTGLLMIKSVVYAFGNCSEHILSQ